MPSHRFYVPDLSPPVVYLDKEESHHARRVMRVGVGDPVELFDGAGTVAQAVVAELKPELVLRVTRRNHIPALEPHITLAVAIPKGDRASVLVEKAAELGADVLVPLRTTRSVVDPREGKLDRLQRIALEAAKQCGRAWMMSVEPPMDLPDLLRQTGYDTKLIADTSGVLATNTPVKPTPSRILLLIGPEGGWTDDERRAAVSAGFAPWSFNPNMLRIETAALAALAILRQRA